MEFPVDVLASVSHEDLERSAHSCMSELLHSDPEHSQYFTLTTGRKVQICLSNVGFIPLYGANVKHKVLALFAPEDLFTAVALFMDDQWYAVKDILRTADPAREGLVKVRSVAERIVLYVLNRIVYRTNEMSAGEVPFLCHGENGFAKILWKSGEAVGFYSVKPRGSLCNNFVSQCYLLPVMDSIFVRKNHRGNKHGLQMLEDFVDSFKDDELGLKYPLSPAMSKVCRNYLNRYPADVDLLWEVEGVGGPYQKTRVATKLSTQTLRGGLLSWGKEDGNNRQAVEDKVEMTSLDITEEIIVTNKRLKVPEETHGTPISTRTRSSEHKQKKRMREEKEMSAEESHPQKISRVEEPEAEAVVWEAEVEKSGEVVAEAPDEEDQVAPQNPVVEEEPVNQAMEVNGELAKELHEEEEEAALEEAEDEGPGIIKAKDVLQNGTVREEEEEMDMDEAALEQDPTDAVETLEEELKEAAEEKTEGEMAPEANEHQEEPSLVVEEEEETSSAVVKEGVAENKLAQEIPKAAVSEEKEEKDTDASAEEKREVAQGDEEKLEVIPGAEEKLEVIPGAEEKQEVALEAEERLKVSAEAEEKLEVSAEAEENLEVSAEAEEKPEVNAEAEQKPTDTSNAEEELEVAPGTEEKLEAPIEAEEELEAPPEAEAEVAPEAKTKQKVVSTAEKKQEEVNEPELASPAKESSKESSDAPSEGRQGLEESVETEDAPVDHEGVQEVSTGSPGEHQSDSEKGHENMDRLELEEEEDGEENTDLVAEDECRGEGEKKSLEESPESLVPDVRVLRGRRTKPVPPTPKRSFKRVAKKEDKVTTEEERMTIDEESMGADVPEEEKVTTEEEEEVEEVEHSSEGEGPEEEPPVIDRRVLRRKIKVIQSMPNPKSKRRSKI